MQTAGVDRPEELRLPPHLREVLLAAVVQHVLDTQGGADFIERVVRAGYSGWDRASDVDLLWKVADSYESVDELWPAVGGQVRQQRLGQLADALRGPELRGRALQAATREYLCEPLFWDSLNTWCLERGVEPVFSEEEFEAAYESQHGSSAAEYAAADQARG